MLSRKVRSFATYGLKELFRKIEYELSAAI